MKLSTIFLFILIACSENGSQNANVPSDSTPGEKVDGNVKADTTVQTDFHTTYTDVIDNLFVFVNKKDWPRVAAFYKTANKKNVGFFKDLFTSQSLSKLELINASKKGNGVYVTTRAVKQNDLSASTVCFLFEIENNQVLNQVETNCK
jgi:hypothetical protein